MGTVINGTKVNNFYINGSKVNGFAKNGEIVFKREGDAVAPVYNSLGIVRNNNAGETRDTHYAKIGDSVRVLIYFSEQLAVEPKVKIANKEFVATYRPLSSTNGLSAYYADCDLTEDLGLDVGEIQLEVYGYADAAGNVGVKLTNADINNSAHEYVIFDDIPPEITIKDGENETVGDATNGYSKISFKIYDNVALAGYTVNGVNGGTVSQSQWGDINNITKEFKGCKEGNNILILKDMSGNEASIEFKLI